MDERRWRGAGPPGTDLDLSGKELSRTASFGPWVCRHWMQGLHPHCQRGLWEDMGSALVKPCPVSEGRDQRPELLLQLHTCPAALP